MLWNHTLYAWWEDCPNGEGVNTRSTTESCKIIKCRTGNYLEGVCKTCPAGYYCPDGQQKKLCEKGKYSIEGSATCLPCQNTWAHIVYIGIADNSICPFECETGYTYNQVSKKCEANNCQWTLPANATLNTQNKPNNSTTSYFYDETSTQACSFKCQEYYHYDAINKKCIANTCQGTLPTNANVNNANAKPRNNTTDYF